MQVSEELAAILLAAEKECRETERITDKHPNLTELDAYAVLEKLIASKQKLGEKVVGYKLGYTSRAMQEQMGVDQPIYGMLFDYMLLQNYDILDSRSLIHPKIEAEIAFVLKADLEGPSVTREEVIAATDYIIPVLEVVDSRYKNYRFTMVDVIADNNSAARVILGDKRFSPDSLNLAQVQVKLNQNGMLVQSGSSADVLGHPADALVWLSRCCHTQGKKLSAGQIILSGGMTRAIDLQQGDQIEADFGELGVVRLIMEKE